MIKRMGVLAFIFSVWISMVIPGILIAQEVPSPPCSGCGGVPAVPKPFMIIPPSPLVSPTVPNALEYDGTNLWLTGKNGTRGSVFSGNAPSEFNNTVTFGSSGILDFNTGSVINFADGSVWKSTGLIFGTGTNLSFPDGSAWDSSGLIFGTGGTETLPDGSTWNYSGITSHGSFTFDGSLIFNPSSISNPMPGQKIYYISPTMTNIALNIPSWAKWIEVDIWGGGGGGYTSTYLGGGGGYEHVETPVPNNPKSVFYGRQSLCVFIGSGGAVNSSGNTSTITAFSGLNCTGTAEEFFQATGGANGSSTSQGLQGTAHSGYQGVIGGTMPNTGAFVNEWGNIIAKNTSKPGNNSTNMSSSITQSTLTQFGYGEEPNQAGWQGLIIVTYH